MAKPNKCVFSINVYALPKNAIPSNHISQK